MRAWFSPWSCFAFSSPGWLDWSISPFGRATWPSFLGHTSYAVVAVQVAFMGGLALGNAWFGVKADSSPNPLALYGWLGWDRRLCLAFPTYTFCHEAFVGLARHGQPGSSGLLALKFVFSFLTILCPTVLMGATFPVLTRFITRAPF